MRAEIEIVAYSALAPAATALAAAWLCRRMAPAEIAERYALPVALAVGFFTGYWLLPDWAPLAPARHWHWLPYLALAAVLGAITQAQGVSTPERWLVYVALAVIAAWQLVPMWKHLNPPRSIAIPCLAAYLFLLMALLSSLPDRLRGRLFGGLLAASAVALSAMIIDVSVVLGQVAVVAATALAGCWMAMFFGLCTPTAVRGLIPVFAVLVGGLAYVGAIELSPHRPITFLAPAAPLLLWLFAFGPLARLQGWTAALAQSAAVLVVLIGALACVAFEALASIAASA